MNKFAFPRSHHLNITTEGSVLSWNWNGLSELFSSSSGGILAATEARDGSGLLAVGDNHLVLLHDIQSGANRSYRLKGTEGQIRLLEYSHDSKTLFFTTSLQNAVQSYSIPQAKLLSPGYTHPSPPTVLAVSPSSHLLLSASESPPTIYLQNLILGTQPMLLQPNASAKRVVNAAFHPERPNIFLLTFADGTLAAYDSTRLPRAGMKPLGTAGTTQTGEIGHFRKLHHAMSVGTKDPEASIDAAVLGGYDDGTKTVNIGARGVGIVAAAFLPGYKARAVSVGADGKCRLVDFDAGGKILRTWHVRGPASSLSVLALKEETLIGRKGRRKQTAFNDGPSTNHVIAVGRRDGKVLLFDSLGLLLDERTVDPDAGPVMGLEWVTGPRLSTQRPKRKSVTSPSVQIETPVPLPEQNPSTSKQKTSNNIQQDRRAALDIFNSALTETRNKANLQQTPNDDIEGSEDAENDWGTVHHVKLDNPTKPVIPQITNTNYMDLFSPVKKPTEQRQSPSRPRVRPRLSSTTFETSPSHTSPVRSSPIRRSPFKYPHVPSSPTPAATHPQPAKIPGLKTKPLNAPLLVQPRSVGKGRRVSLRRLPGSYVSSMSSRNTSSSSNASRDARNGRLLADLRRLGGNGLSTLGLLAPYIDKTLPRRPHEKVNDETNSVMEVPDVTKVNTKRLKRPQQDELDDHPEDEEEEDIWLDEEQSVQKRRRGKQKESTDTNASANAEMDEEAYDDGLSNCDGHCKCHNEILRQLGALQAEMQALRVEVSRLRGRT